jgi:mannosyltransferase OCH1-like enzyme
MKPEILYPIIFFAIYICIKRTLHINNDIAVYLFITIYYTLLKPRYGVFAALILLIFHSMCTPREGMKSNIEIDDAANDVLSTDAVPKHIYQTWHTKSMPPKMKKCVEKLKRDNPEFTHHLFSDEECREFIETKFDKEVLDAYDGLIPGAFKADLWRYCVLYENGGVYLDIKYQCNDGFRLKDIANDNLFVREYNGEGTGLAERPVYTGIMISKPKNEVFMRCIRRICRNVKNKYYGKDNTEPTGPILMGSFFTEEEKAKMKYAYHETNDIGYIRHIKDGKDVLSWYPEYRSEQKNKSKTGYWKDLWLERKIYAEI